MLRVCVCVAAISCHHSSHVSCVFVHHYLPGAFLWSRIAGVKSQAWVTCSLVILFAVALCVSCLRNSCSVYRIALCLSNALVGIPFGNEGPGIPTNVCSSINTARCLAPSRHQCVSLRQHTNTMHLNLLMLPSSSYSMLGITL